MSLSLKHKFKSPLPDGVNPNLIRPSNWNDEHDLIIPENTIVGRNDSGDGPAKALTSAEVAALLGGDIGGIDAVEDDPAPKLGGDLDLNGHHIIGLQVGTDVQAYSANLDAWSLVTSDTDGTLSANSDSKIATQKAVKTYADQLIAAADVMVFKGVIDCSANPNYLAADAGWTYRVSAAGKIGGASGTNVEVGDLLLCLVDGSASGNQATVGSNWSIAQTNIDGAVVGPASATSGNIATFDGTTGKNIQDGGIAASSLYRSGGTDVTISDGGTGASTAPAAFDNLSPTITRGDIIARGASGNQRVALGTSGYFVGSDGTDTKFLGFLQSGTGAVTRAWQDKLRERCICVLDFIPVTEHAAIRGFTSTTDVSSYILSAVTAAAILRCSVYFPAGQYTVGASVTIANSYVAFLGDGSLNTIIRRDFATGPTFAFNNASNAVIFNPGVVGIGFIRNTSTSLGSSNVAHIKIVSGLQSVIADVRMDNTVEGIEFVGGDLFFLDRISLVGDYTATDKARFGIKASQLAVPVSGSHAHPSYVLMKDVWISGSGVNTGFAYPLWILSGEYWVVGEGCYFGQGKFYNVLIEQGTDNAIFLDLLFQGAYIDTAGVDGVHITGSGVASGQTWDASARTGGDGSGLGLNFAFDNCVVKGNGSGGGDGIKVDGTSRGGTYPQFVHGMRVNNCNVASWLGNGINLQGGIDITVSNNTINGNNYSNTTSGSGLILGATLVRPIVVGNRIGGDAFNLTTSQHQVYPVDIVSGCSHYTVANNLCELNANPIRDGAADGILFNNKDGSETSTTLISRNPLTIKTALDGPLGVLSSKAGGFSVNYTNNPAAGAINDVINYAFNLATDNGTLYNAGVMQIIQQIAANGSQTSAYAFYTTRAAALALEMVLGGGMQVGSPTGGAPGAGNLAVQGAIMSAAPVTKTGTSGSVGATDSSIIVNASGTFTLTLPAATTTNTGRWLYIKSIAAQTVNSASSNVVPINSATAGSAILTNTAGKWAILQSNGTNWVIMASN